MLEQVSEQGARPAGGIALLVKAAVAAERLGFEQPGQATLDAAIELLEALARHSPSELARASVTIGPNGVPSIVLSSGDGPAEVDVTVSPEGIYHVSAYRPATGAVDETVVGSPAEVLDAVVRAL